MHVEHVWMHLKIKQIKYQILVYTQHLPVYSPQFSQSQQMSQWLQTKIVWMLDSLSIAPFLDTSEKWHTQNKMVTILEPFWL